MDNKLVDMAVETTDFGAELIAQADAAAARSLLGIGSGGSGDVESVNGMTGDVVLTAADVGAATTAQGALADTATQPGDNVSTLVNDAGYLTAAPVSSVNGDTGAVVLTAGDVGAADQVHTHAAATNLAAGFMSSADKGYLDRFVAGLVGYIQGLNLVYLGTDSMRVDPGAVWIPGTGELLALTSPITLSSMVMTASTFYHLYIYNNGGTPAIEYTTTAPVLNFGTSFVKTGDTSRRYLGSVLCRPTANTLSNFKMCPCANLVMYKQVQDGAPFRVLQTGAATVETAVSLATCIPETASFAKLRVFTTASVNGYTGVSDDSASGPPTSGMVALANGLGGWVDHPFNSSRQITYWNQSAPAGGSGVFVDVYGYYFSR